MTPAGTRLVSDRTPRRNRRAGQVSLPHLRRRPQPGAGREQPGSRGGIAAAYACSNPEPVCEVAT
jgi:hypothetical protein